jgi:hypothetical protein
MNRVGHDGFSFWFDGFRPALASSAKLERISMRPSTRATFQANSMDQSVRMVCRASPIGAAAVVLLSVIANRAHTRGQMGTTEIVAG